MSVQEVMSVRNQEVGAGKREGGQCVTVRERSRKAYRGRSAHTAVLSGSLRMVLLPPQPDGGATRPALLRGPAGGRVPASRPPGGRQRGPFPGLPHLQEVKDPAGLYCLHREMLK